MKVLNCGVEMTPEELRKSRGGMCACGCSVGIGADSGTNGAEQGDTCFCSCDLDNESERHATSDGAAKYVWVY